MGNWWNSNQEEPKKQPKQQPKQQGEEVISYQGPVSEQMFRVLIFMNVVGPDGLSFAARYSLIVPDYNMDTFTNTLNANSVVYTVVPLEMQEWRGEDF